MDSNPKKSREENPDLPLVADNLEDILEKANEQLLRHREWLANLPRDSNIVPTPTIQSLILVTSPPSLIPRQNTLSECNDISSVAFNAGANSASSVFSISLSSASATITSLNNVIITAQASASAALSSAASSVLIAQISMDSAVSAAEKSASMMVASASMMVASANAAANDAKVRATDQIQKAEASIILANQAAEASILASQTAAMNTTKFALSLTFAILGSSVISIIFFSLVIRLRKHRTEKRQAKLKEKIHLRNTTPSPTSASTPSYLEPRRPFISPEPGITERPNQKFPQYEIPLRNPGRENAQTRRVEADFDNDKSDINLNEVKNETRTTIPLNVVSSIPRQRPDSPKRRFTEGFSPREVEEVVKSQDKHRTFSPASSKSTIKRPPSRKPTLQYDPDRPQDPPTWLETETDESAAQSDQSSSRLASPRRSLSQKAGVHKSIIGAAI